jgi:UDP-arabinose 4-epimerase
MEGYRDRLRSAALDAPIAEVSALQRPPEPKRHAARQLEWNRTVKRVLVTGGAGYIGSHTCKCLAARGIEPVVYDNLSRGHADAVRWGPLVQGDISDRDKLQSAITLFQPDSVIHFAAFAYVGESVADPAKYYRNNVSGTLTLLEAMRATGVDKLVFSSSCATYGVPGHLPISEATPQAPISPYGRTKLMVEQILADSGRAYGLRSVALRYFNAAGADPEGEIGERHDPETHLIPRALMAAAGLIPALEVFGDDYPTPDGTCIRDYVHVTDLAEGHVAALRHLDADGANVSLNLGTGQGTSIRELLRSIARVTGHEVPVILQPRREGDPPAIWADASRAKTVLDFSPVHSDTDTIIRTAWAFLTQKPPRAGGHGPTPAQ